MYLTYNRVYRDVVDYAENHRQSLGQVGTVVGIARDGAVLATMLATFLDKPLQFLTVKNAKSSKLQPTFHWSQDIEEMEPPLLFVDDVSSTGTTMGVVSDNCPVDCSCFVYSAVPGSLDGLAFRSAHTVREMTKVEPDSPEWLVMPWDEFEWNHVLSDYSPTGTTDYSLFEHRRIGYDLDGVVFPDIEDDDALDGILDSYPEWEHQSADDCLAIDEEIMDLRLDCCSKPTLIPDHPFYVVTGRHLAVRELTVDQLHNSIPDCKLLLRDSFFLPDHTDPEDIVAVSKFKASKIDCLLLNDYFESDSEQAIMIKGLLTTRCRIWWVDETGERYLV